MLPIFQLFLYFKRQTCCLLIIRVYSLPFFYADDLLKPSSQMQGDVILCLMICFSVSMTPSSYVFAATPQR